MGSHDSLEGLENVGMKVRDLEEQPTSNPSSQTGKQFSLLGAQVGVLGNFLLIMIITRNPRTQKIPNI